MCLMTTMLCAAEREVVIPCDWGNIAATIADTEAGSNTAVLIVAGSGPTDRNGNSGLNLNTYCYKMLADGLVNEGFAVLRYDKRAVGASYLPAEEIANLLFDDYVEDAARCVAWLREAGYGKVIIAGHSEGGSIALEVVSRGLADVDGVVLLCAPGYAMDRILMTQLSAQLVPSHMGLMVQAERIIRSLKGGELVAAERLPKELVSLFHPTVQPFLISSMACDPCAAIKRCSQPLLIVTGGRDIQVSVDNGEALLAASTTARHTNFESMCHTLKDAANSDRVEQLVSVYTNPTLPLTEGLVAEITEFINNL